ncbi:MAG: glycine zipper 2TM domain-containing protein [Rhodoferax sp.]
MTPHHITRPLLVLATAVLTALGGCATSSPDVISRDQAQRPSRVEDGVVLSVRNVTIDGNQSGMGAAAGGIVGGVLGSTRGARGAESAVIGVLGAVAGAVAGNAIERSTTKEAAVELIVAFKGGERRAIVQAQGDQALAPGDAVLVITTGGKVRVVRAPR